jgi:uncharacterized protein (DUF983 family)
MSEQMPQSNPVISGLLCRCPRCGKGPMFKGFLTVRSRCDVCGFDLQAADSGDGPVFFITLLGGIIVAIGAVSTEIAFDPPLWVEFALWLPLTILICGGLLRPAKSLLIALQFHFKAAQMKASKQGNE